MVENSFFIKSVFKSLKFAYQRVLVIFIAIFIGACVSSAFLNIYFDIDSKMSKELKAYGANFVITPLNQDDNFIKETKYKEIVSKIDKNSLIGITPYLYGFYSFGTNSGIVVGVDFAGLKKSKPFLDIRKGSMNLGDFADDSAFVGMNLAKSLEVNVGDKITVTNAKNGIRKDVVVKAIYYGGDETDGLMFVSLSMAQELLNEGKVINYANAVINGDYESISKLSQTLSDDTISAKPIAQISLSEGAILDKIKALMALISVIILIISSTSVNTTLSSIIFSRRKEIALNMALGACRKDIIKLFGAEISILALLSSLLGALSGYILAQILGYAVFKTGIDFRVLSVIFAILISLIFSAIASFYPLKQALNVNLADNLRGE